jgi:hypothetical protein
MRDSNLRGSRTPRFAAIVLVLITATLVAACGGNTTPSAAASATPTPVITPDPHLTEPVSIDTIFVELQKAGLDLTGNTASTGPAGEPVKSIAATYENWPLILSGYSSSAALRGTTGYDPAKPIGQGDPPITLVGLNVQIEFGPQTSNTVIPEAPDARRLEAAQELVRVLDPLIGPLTQVSATLLPLPTATGLPSPSAPTAAPSASPSASPS